MLKNSQAKSDQDKEIENFLKKEKKKDEIKNINIMF